MAHKKEAGISARLYRVLPIEQKYALVATGLMSLLLAALIINPEFTNNRTPERVKLLLALAAGSITYMLVGYLGLEAKIPWNKTQIRAASSLIAFSVAIVLSRYGVSSASELFSIAESIAVITGLAIALETYLSQARQEKLSNSFTLIEVATKHISESDFSTLKSVHQNTYEGCQAKPGHFVTFEGGEVKQNRISELFIPEGSGLSVYGKLSRPESLLETSDLNFTCLGAVRLIAEQLNLIAFEVFNGQIEVRIVYSELSDVIEIVCNFLRIALKTDPDDSNDIRRRFQYLLKMEEKFPPSSYPKRTFSALS